MSRSTWIHLKTDAVAKLTEACPALSRHLPERDALATILALAEARLTVRPRDGRIGPDLRAEPVPEGDEAAQALLDLVARLAIERASNPGSNSNAPFGDWIEAHGFSRLSVALAGSADERRQLKAVAGLVAAAVRTLSERAASIALAHMQDILDRDLPGVRFERLSLTAPAAWMLAPESGGRPDRPQVLERRRQAMSAYGALSATLLDPEVTRAIDRGTPLAPLLATRHGLSAAELRALRGARRQENAVETLTDFHVAVEELKAHEVPLHEWPGCGRPLRAEAWEASPWLKGSRQHVVRPDYLGEDPSAVRDTIGALRDDLLRPLVAERRRLGGFPLDHRIESFVRTIELGSANGGGEPRRRLIAALRTAIVGPRRPKAFHEAVALWHRRAASLSALRHERRADRPGWPALCAPWTSACGRFAVVALASAADLVEEGRFLDHCVGGYYETCRRGTTQILSLREEARRVATVELRLGVDAAPITLEVGQFKGRGNAAPPPDHHDALRAFLRAIRGGSHPIDGRRIARHVKRMRDTWDGATGDILALDHAREVFPLYRPLLPRGLPAGFDDWCAASGLNAALDAALAHVAAGPRKGSDHPILS